MNNPRAQQYERWNAVHDSLSHLWQRGVLTENMSHVLEACAHGKVNIVVSGDDNAAATTSDGATRVTEIAEIWRLDGPMYSLHQMFCFDPSALQHRGSTEFPKLLQRLEDEVIPFKLIWLR